MSSPLSKEVIALVVIELDNRNESKRLDDIIVRLDKIQADVTSIGITVGSTGSTISQEDQATLEAHKQRILELEKQLESINTQPPQ